MKKPVEPPARNEPLIESAQPSESGLSDEQYNELLRVVGVYKRQADKCASAGAYLAACVMIGAALEGALLTMCGCYYGDIPDGLKPKCRKNKKQRPVIDWSLSDFVNIARELNWLPAGLDLQGEWSSKKAEIGDYAEVVHQLRNLVHPGRYVQDMSRKRITKRYYDSCEETFGGCTEYLLDKIGQSLKEAHDKGEF